jgi:SSS family solute:Na+ symporter
LHYIDLIIFFLFTGGIVLYGLSFAKRSVSAKEFTSASQSLPGWVVGMSIFATYVSSISYLGYPGKAYAGDWNAFVFSLSIPIASYVAARYFVPFYRKQWSVSAYSFLEERFGVWARMYASACYLLTQVARMGSILYLLALPMNVLMGWEIHVVILVTSIAILLYAISGGIRAVVWTEAVQGIILIGGALLCLALLLIYMPGGPKAALDVAINDGKMSLGSFSLTDVSTSTFWVCMIYGIFINLQNYGIDQNYVQRYHTATSDREAKKAALFGGYLFIPVSLVFFMIGTALYAYYKLQPGQLPDGLLPDYVFPYFIVNQLPVGLTGLLIASIFAAGMSTVATSITSSATIVLTDYYKRLRSQTSEREDITVLKGSCLIVGLLGSTVALALVNVESILDAWWKLSSIFSGGMLGLFLLAIIGTGKAGMERRRMAAMIGVICGFLVIAWISADTWLGLPESGIHEYLAIVLGTLTIFLVGFAMTLLLPKGNIQLQKDKSDE